jgi:hypothetical protein
MSDLITVSQNLQFETVIETTINLIQNNNESSESNTVFDQILFDESDEFDFNFGKRGEKFTVFNINLGTNDCPRFSCACHKNNVAVRMAIKKSTPLCQFYLHMLPKQKIP